MPRLSECDRHHHADHESSFGLGGYSGEIAKGSLFSSSSRCLFPASPKFHRRSQILGAPSANHVVPGSIYEPSWLVDTRVNICVDLFLTLVGLDKGTWIVSILVTV